MNWLVILLLAIVVVFSRYIFLEPRLPLRLSDRALQFFRYSAAAVLTAISGPPVVFVHDHQLALSTENTYMICACVAVALAYLTRHTLLTTIISMGGFFSSFTDV